MLDIWVAAAITTGTPAVADGVAYLRYLSVVRAIGLKHGVDGLKAAKAIAPPLRRPQVK